MSELVQTVFISSLTFDCKCCEPTVNKWISKKKDLHELEHISKLLTLLRLRLVQWIFVFPNGICIYYYVSHMYHTEIINSYKFNL